MVVVDCGGDSVVVAMKEVVTVSMVTVVVVVW